jgi:hypothetical protein
MDGHTAQMSFWTRPLRAMTSGGVAKVASALQGAQGRSERFRSRAPQGGPTVQRACAKPDLQRSLST